MQVIVILIVVGALGMNSKGLKKRQEELEIGERIRDYRNYNIIKIDPNTE